MNQSTIRKPVDKSILFNRIMYTGFVLLSVYHLVLNKEPGNALSNLGIALIFDPFDQKVMWNDRPAFQRVWLYAHISVFFTLLVYVVVAHFSTNPL